MIKLSFPNANTTSTTNLYRQAEEEVVDYLETHPDATVEVWIEEKLCCRVRQSAEQRAKTIARTVFAPLPAAD